MIGMHETGMPIKLCLFKQGTTMLDQGTIMLDKDIAAAIIAAVDAGFEAQTRFTQDMVRCPSVRGQEHTIQDLMADAMARRGLSVDHWKVKVDDIKDLPGFAPVVDATLKMLTMLLERIVRRIAMGVR
jgi:protein-disulfide isomerase-like protein with CxxC motif